MWLVGPSVMSVCLNNGAMIIKQELETSKHIDIYIDIARGEALNNIQALSMDLLVCPRESRTILERDSSCFVR